MPKLKLSFDVIMTTPGTDIKCITTIDKCIGDETDTSIYPCPLNETQEFILDDARDGKYTVRFIMEGKKDADTVMDGDRVIESPEVELQNFKFDGYGFDDLIPKIAIYTHDFNGHGETQVEPFDMVMGCNGDVIFEFTTPLYKWLLEHAD